MARHTTVSIPVELGEKIKKRIEGTGFRSVSDYTTYVLRQIVSSAEMREKSKGFKKEDHDEIKRRLKALDYI
ncbi:MAG: CopG family transcriptional regulator [Candidatus Diapherotrites archaeon]|nr:CopG family transcriptional regulator [Candidatus Diapherotrites archaeon]